MRSSGLTKSGEPSFVTRSTKSMMAFFDAVSFHDGNGSCARTIEGTQNATTSVSLMNFAFMAGSNRQWTSTSSESYWICVTCWVLYKQSVLFWSELLEY